MSQKELSLKPDFGDAGAAELIRASLEKAGRAHTPAVVAGHGWTVASASLSFSVW